MEKRISTSYRKLDFNGLEYDPNRRISHMALAEIYFYTATIYKWKKLLLRDDYKIIIIESLYHLSNTGIADIYGFVIMPTHLHFIWKMNRLNGKESGQGSFLKYTAHMFLRKLTKENPGFLRSFEVKSKVKKHEFWQRDPDTFRLYTRPVAFQKLNYIHKNPLAAHWKLALDPCDYKYSSASFYSTGISEFKFLKDLRKVFDG